MTFDANEENRLREIVREGIKSGLADIGLHADEAKELRADFKHLRDWRVAMQRARDQISRSAIITAITGIIGILVVGFRETIIGFFVSK
jgi:hypothetical protein